MKQIVMLILSVMTAVMFTGCSKPAPDMDSIRTNLVLEIFELVKREKHADAVVKIQKLRELDRTSVSLPELESVEKANRDLQKVNRLLEQNKRKEAQEMLNSVIRSRGRSRGAFRTAEKLRDMIRMEQLTDQMIDPSPWFPRAGKMRFMTASEVLLASVAEFQALAKKWDVPLQLRQKVNARLAKVPVMRKQENSRASFSLETFFAGSGTEKLFQEVFTSEVEKVKYRDFFDKVPEESFDQTISALIVISFEGTYMHDVMSF